MTATAKKGLTCTNSISTLVPAVDTTAKKLVAKLQDLEMQNRRITREIESVKTALAFAGVKPGKFSMQEHGYVAKQPFASMTLTECCKTILKDYRLQWLSKSEIEYLITRGGYKFSAKDSKNSVGVTLQRMKDDGECEVERVRGARGNRYRWMPEGSTDAASTSNKRE